MRSSSLLRRSTGSGLVLALAASLFVAVPAMAATPGDTTFSLPVNNVEFWQPTPDGSRIVFSSYGDSAIFIIDTTTNMVSPVDDPFTLINGPAGVAISPDGLTAYVANFDAASILIIDIPTGTVTGEIVDSQFLAPWAVAINSAGDRLYVQEDNAGLFYMIDLGTNLVTSTVDVSAYGSSATHFVVRVFLSNDDALAYLEHSDGSIIVIDIANSSVADVFGSAGFDSSLGSCISLDGASLYQAQTTNLVIRRLSLETGLVLATNPSTPRSPADPVSPTNCTVSPDGKSVFFTDEPASGPGLVTEYDAETLALIAIHSFDDVDRTQQVMVFSACEGYVTGRSGTAQTLDFGCAAAPELAATGSPASPLLGSTLLAALLLVLGFGAVAVRARYRSARSSQ